MIDFQFKYTTPRTQIIADEARKAPGSKTNIITNYSLLITH